MNEENLMNIEEVNSRRSREQHSADSRKGGIASGKARRKKKKLREIMETVGDFEIKGINRLKLKSMFPDLKDEDLTYDVLVVAAAYQEATKGKVRAMEFIRDTKGEKVSEDVNINIDGKRSKEIADYILGKSDDVEVE